jgi:hypothetical protein
LSGSFSLAETGLTGTPVASAWCGDEIVLELPGANLLPAALLSRKTERAAHEGHVQHRLAITPRSWRQLKARFRYYKLTLNLDSCSAFFSKPCPPFAPALHWYSAVCWCRRTGVYAL